MKKKFPVFKTTSLAVLAGLGVYAIWNHNAMGQTSSQGKPSLSVNSMKLSADSTWKVNNSYIQQIKQLQQEIELQLQNQLQSEWEQEQSQLQALWQQAQSQLQQQLPQQPQWPSQNGGPQGEQSVLPNQSQSQANRLASLPTNTQPSGNWAGYIAAPTSESYTSVSGTWTVPKISGNPSGVAAQWIGLGGVTNHDLLQMGTLEQFQNGQPVAQVFWEKLPNAAQPVMTVPIGSTIHAKISQASGTTWDVTFSAQTPAGKTISKTIPVSVDNSYAAGIGTSAEWISEDPSNTNNNLFPLANTGTVQYSNAMVNGHAFDTSSNQVTPVALVDNYGNLLMAPSAVGANGSSFSTTTLSTGVGSGGQFIEVTGGQTLIPGSGDTWTGGRHHHFHGQGWNGYTVYGYGNGLGDNSGW